MKHFHIFTVEGLYAQAFIRLLESSGDMADHVYIFRKKDSIYNDYPQHLSNRLIYCTNFLCLLFVLIPKLLKSNTWIYFHYLPYGPSLMIWRVFRSLLKRSTWIIWGGDVKVYHKQKSSFSSYIYEVLRKQLIPTFPEIASFIKEDAEEAIRLYYSKASYHQILYPIPINMKNFERINERISYNSFTNIMVGNSADPSNNHTEILNVLSKYKEETINIFCPLSYYNDENYIRQIQTLGNSIFGSKFVALTEMMTPENYSELLYSMDIGIMNHERQQGLGTVLPLLFHSKKVFLRKNTSSHRFLTLNGCTIYDTDKIGSMSWDEFVSYNNIKLSRNNKIISELTSSNYCIDLWLKLFNRHNNDQRN